MHVSEILAEEDKSELKVLKERCSRFINESESYPLYKYLPRGYDDLQRVKVRHRKVDILGEAMNVAFKNKDLRMAQRAIWTSGTDNPPTHPRIVEAFESFYVFPVDGYNFIYNNVSKGAYNLVDLDPIIEQFGERKGVEVIAEVLEFSYTSEHLNEGIKSGSEIILYGIPFYYAVRTSSVDNYNQLLTDISNV